MYFIKVVGMELYFKTKIKDETSDLVKHGQGDLMAMKQWIDNLEKIVEQRQETKGANINGTNVVIE